MSNYPIKAEIPLPLIMMLAQSSSIKADTISNEASVNHMLPLDSTHTDAMRNDKRKSIGSKYQ